MIRPLLTALATTLLLGTAVAAPALKADVVVSGALVTVGDMFDDAGANADQALFRAPKPGTTGIVALADINAAAARIGLTGYSAGSLSAIRVTRAASIVDETVFTNLIVADLTQRGIITGEVTANTTFSQLIPTFNAEAVAQPAMLVSLRYLPGNGAFSARFAIAGLEHPVDVTGSIELMVEAPHLKANLPAGTVLGADNVEMRAVPLRFAESAGIAQMDQLIGMALTRQSREGMLLRPADVTTPMLISKNELVTIYFRKGPMTLTVKGQAITGAADGRPLQVLNLMSKRVISATAIAAGAVEVSADPLTLAGL